MLRASFGARCRRLRAAAGVSQERFAQSVGMDRTYYASIETGLRNVTLYKMKQIADGFGVTLSELLEGVGEEEGLEVQ